MNATLIIESASQTLAGKQSFPEAVALLLKEGVEYYHVDYATLKKTFYDGAEGVVTAPMVYEGLPEIEADFSAADLQTNIRDSQLHGQNFHDFTQRAMKAGVQSYYAFLRGGRVTYLGRQGDQHTSGSLAGSLSEYSVHHSPSDGFGKESMTIRKSCERRCPITHHLESDAYFIHTATAH